MEIHCTDCSSLLDDDHILQENQRKTQWVVMLTAVVMVIEIVAGYMSGSMALTADGFHMASHAGALLIALFAYRFARSKNFNKRLSFGAGKLIPLGGYTSAVILGIVGILVFVESATRLFQPVSINYNEAIGVAVLGFVANVISAIILHQSESHVHLHSDNEAEHDHEEGHKEHSGAKHVHDHNIRSAFLHILADAVTSVLAVGALILAKSSGMVWLDPAVGILGAVLIFIWAIQLCKDTGWELLDGHSKTVNWVKLKSEVEQGGNRILDFHVWRIAPTATACELVVESKVQKGSEYYRSLLREKFLIRHVIVEEKIIS